MKDDTISRQAAIDALWKALYKYEDETEKQFQTSEDLDVGDWIEHRIYVQNMNDIDRQTILNLPSAQQWIPCSERLPEKAYGRYWVCTDTGYQCQCRWTDDVYGLGSSGKWTWKIFDIPQYSHVVAWMPLPEPWKGEGNERA